MTDLYSIGREITKEFFGESPLYIGQIIETVNNRKVKIISGQYYSNARLSNWWEWREIRKNGGLGKIEHGYGYIENGKLQTKQETGM
jgi:hypothetical protein